MSEVCVDHIVEAVQSGAKLYIGRNYEGKRKVKLLKGPFGLFAERFRCSEDDLASLKLRLARPGHYPRFSNQS
jgi:hypothetical protein